MLRGFSLDLSAFVLIALPVITAALAYGKDPSLPILGGKNGLVVRIVPRLAFPSIAGWLVKVWYHE